MRTTSVDAVVVGSGPNGLVAANLLADAGWSVVVLEEQETPGGGVRSAALTAPGFVNDLCSSFYPFAIAGSPLSALELERSGLRWSHAPTVLAHVTPEGRSVTLARDLAVTEESVGRWAAPDGLRWRRAYRDWLAVERDLLAALLTPFPPLRAGLDLLRHNGIGDALRLTRRLLLPAVTLGRELFAGDGARLLLAGLALHADVPVTSATSGGYGLLLAMLAQQHGFPVPVGGAASLTDALVRRLRSRGGEVVCAAAVTSIGVTGGVARDVSTADGRRYRAGRAVLADVAASTLYTRLLAPSAVPASLLDDLRRLEYDPATVKVDWALSGPVPWLEPAAALAGTVHIGSLAGMAWWSSFAGGSALPADPASPAGSVGSGDAPFLVCGQMTTADPTRSPAGTQAFWAYTRVPRREHWPAGEGADDARVVADVVARMEALLERCAPGFADLVLNRRVTGPAQLQQENANLVGGALGGGTSAIHQQLFLRPVPGLGRADTPVDRLFLASASAHPGGGVHGGPGANAARAALARDRAAVGRLYRGTVAALQRSITST